MTALLVDADSFAYKSCILAETEITWDEDTFTLTSDKSKVIRNIHSFLGKLKETHGGYELKLFLSGETSSGLPDFRKELEPSYKANRKGTRKPLGLKWLRETYMPEHWEVFTAPRLEADDLLGIAATTPRHFNKSVIYSIDKDLRQIPGKHWDTEGVVEVTPEEGWRFTMYQTLVGDPVDGYKGCPGVGPVKAQAVLRKAEDLNEPYWPFIVDTYTSAGLTENAALLQARLARILQHGDYSFETHKIKLWRPKNA